MSSPEWQLHDGPESDGAGAIVDLEAGFAASAAERTAAGISLAWRKKAVMAVLLLQDALLMLSAGFLAALVRFGSPWPEVTLLPEFGEVFFPQLIPVLLPVWLVIFASSRLYDYDLLCWGSAEFWRVANAITLGFVILILAGYILKTGHISRGWMILAWLLAIGMVGLGRAGFKLLLSRLRCSSVLAGRTLVLGGNEEALALLRRIVKGKASGLDPIGYLAKRPGDLAAEGAARLGDPIEVREVVESRRIDTLLVASSAFTHHEMVEILQEVRGLPVDVHISSGLFEILAPRVFVKEVEGIPMTTVKAAPLTRARFLVKRCFDVTVSSILLVLLAPLLTGVCALIKLTSPGPVLYKQERIGRNRTPFVMYKLRSMTMGCDDGAHKDRVAAQIARGRPQDGALNDAAAAPGAYKTQVDARITGAGRFIRRFSIDELPQLLNVIKGDMSLVGPRPPLRYEVEMYEGWMMRRLEVMPGMTGLWQVSGRANLPYNEMVKLDLYYAQNWSLRFDLSILARTIRVVVFPQGAY